MPDDPGADISPITPRELEVLHLIATGHSAKEVAQKLAIAPRTVERHVDHLKLKTRTRNRAHMVAQAIGAGLITVGSPSLLGSGR